MGRADEGADLDLVEAGRGGQRRRVVVDVEGEGAGATNRANLSSDHNSTYKPLLILRLRSIHAF